jgi:uncharacterized damage-inducible protein DinB
MTVSTLKMYQYHVWANGVILNRLKEFPEDIYHKNIQTGFSSVSKVMSHIYMTDYTWFDIISGKSMREALDYADQFREQIEKLSVKEIENDFSDLSDRYKKILNSEEDVEKVIVLDNPYAGILETSVSEIVLHVVTHGSYHRGNIATMLRQMGYTSVMQDFGLFQFMPQTT